MMALEEFGVGQYGPTEVAVLDDKRSLFATADGVMAVTNWIDGDGRECEPKDACVIVMRLESGYWSTFQIRPVGEEMLQ